MQISYGSKYIPVRYLNKRLYTIPEYSRHVPQCGRLYQGWYLSLQSIDDRIIRILGLVVAIEEQRGGAGAP